jgi:hypothetical protein
LPASAVRISPSVGLGFSARSAAALMIKAGSRRASVEQNAAGAALAEATSEFGRGEPQSAQAVKQRLIGIRRLDRLLDPVDTKPVAGHAASHRRHLC